MPVSAVAPECRVMALSAFPTFEVLPHEKNSVLVVAGCSDGIIRWGVYHHHVHVHLQWCIQSMHGCMVVH